MKWGGSSGSGGNIDEPHSSGEKIPNKRLNVNDEDDDFSNEVTPDLVAKVTGAKSALKPKE